MTQYSGTCLCDSISLQTVGDPEKVFACYCTDCSKNAGGPYQICAKFDKSQVIVRDPQQLQRTWVVKKTHSGSEKHKVFCGRCGCTLYTMPMSHGGEKLIVRTSLLRDGFFEMKPQAEFFTGCRPKFVEGLNGVKAYEQMPGS